MDNLENIDLYYQSQPSPEQTRLFEQRILEDPAFAEDLAFYLSLRQLAKDESDEEKKARFRKLYEETGEIKPAAKMRRLWPILAAAAVLAAIVFGIWTLNRPADPRQLADQYISQEFRTLDVTMGKESSMEVAVRQYNEGNFQEALNHFEDILRSDSANSKALENAGKSAIRLGLWDKALTYFQALEKDSLYANPGKFYQALTLLERGLPGDKRLAKRYLEQVVKANLDKKEIAEEWLDKMK